MLGRKAIEYTYPVGQWPVEQVFTVEMQAVEKIWLQQQIALRTGAEPAQRLLKRPGSARVGERQCLPVQNHRLTR